MIAWTTIEDAIWNWVVTGSGLAADHVIWSRQKVARPSPPYITLALTGIVQIGQDAKKVQENPFVFADIPVVFVDVGDTLTATAHGLQTGDGPVRLTTTGTLPTGLATATDYWIIRVDADTVQVAATFLDAIALTEITFTGGSGTHAIADTAETRRAGAEITHSLDGARELVLSFQCFDNVATGAGSAFGILEKVKTSQRLPTVHAALRTAHVGIARFGNIIPIDGTVGAAYFEPRAVMEVRAFVSSEVSENTTFIQRAAVTKDPPGTDTFIVDTTP